MSSESLHAPRERLSSHALKLHHALVSLIEELEAIDWYRQRADDAEDETLKRLLLHNMREEMEHASMLLEWIRRSDSDFAGHMKTYLFTDKPILEVEKEDEAKGGTEAPPARDRGFTIGRLGPGQDR
jgi:uncharacterized protein